MQNCSVSVPPQPSLVTPARLVRRVLPALAVMIALAAYVGYVTGTRHPHVQMHHDRVVSLTTSITVADGDGASGSFHLPTDVAWVDSNGDYHSHGRPECLPAEPVGTIKVRYATETVADPSGDEHTETLWVDCTSWDPSKDLTAKQRAAL